MLRLYKLGDSISVFRQMWYMAAWLESAEIELRPGPAGVKK
jgi:hypothetical protein